MSGELFQDFDFCNDPALYLYAINIQEAGHTLRIRSNNALIIRLPSHIQLNIPREHTG
jgi:hypothetical protein